jgi:hypothetical protein
MLDYYYDVFKNDYNDYHDDDNIYQFCDNIASRLSKNECIQLINEQFGDQLTAIQEYINEYGDIPIYDNNVYRTYLILAYLALKTYINNQNNDETLSQASTVNNNDD